LILVLDVVTTEPSKWPGVASLRALLDREKDEEAPNLSVLLCEAFVAIYIGLLSYALVRMIIIKMNYTLFHKLLFISGNL